MKKTQKLTDTEKAILMNVINDLRCQRREALRCAGQDKIAIYVQGGMIQGIRSNIGQDLEVEIVDPEDRWKELQTELPFGNY